jgi:hypothetical protein
MSLLLLDSQAQPIDNAKLRTWPRHGMSIASLIVASAHDIRETVRRFEDCGVQLTRINLLSALWSGVDTLPYVRAADGRWDLYRWNPRFFARLDETRERMNAAGIVCQWTFYNLYDWSNRKSGTPAESPYRHNVNGVFWQPDDSTFDVLPDAWSLAAIERLLPHLHLDVNVFEIGNEFPEKALHERVADFIRRLQPKAQISLNRNEDTPGQYVNSKIGGPRFDRIAFHGRQLKAVSDLDRVYPSEPQYKTFRQFMDRCPHDPARVIFSSDGARVSADPINTYDWNTLRDFFQEMKRRGYSTEHQSRAKMSAAPNHDLIESDWFLSVIA